MKNLINFIGRVLKIWFSDKISEKAATESVGPLVIEKVIHTLPWHKTRTWSKRPLAKIKKIIVHQELAEGSVESVNKYHITPGKNNSLSPKGAPHFAYHYGIELDGSVKHVNPHSATTWHCKGQNSSSIGIMVAGNFDGDGHKGTGKPSQKQKINLNKLLDKLTADLNLNNTDIYGHENFGKPACPGYDLMELINNRRSKNE